MPPAPTPLPPLGIGGQSIDSDLSLGWDGERVRAHASRRGDSDEPISPAPPASAGTRTTIKTADSQFGDVLFDGADQAIYYFDKEHGSKSEREDGTTQITYDGHPLYYYAHEGPGLVLCHNVEEFGGLWLAVRLNGERVS